MNFNMPVKLITGVGCIAARKNEIAVFGKKCLIVTGANSAKRCGALADVTAALESLGITYELYDGIGQNPAVALCIEAGKKASDFGADFIFGIGGGSPLDASKAVAVFAANPGMDEDGLYALNWPNKPLPIVLAGTTAGTGSEVTNVAVLTDSKGRKRSIHTYGTYAALSFGDPRYTYLVPDSITLSTGIDAFAHCAESYFNKKSDELARTFAAAGIRLLVEPLKAAVNGGKLSEAQRAALYSASIYGGLAISVTGTCFPHNVGYFLTENYGIPHGFACAAFHPAFIKHCSEYAPADVKQFELDTGLDVQSYTELAESVMPKLDIRLTEGDIDKLLPRWENNGTVNNTPGGMSVDEIKEILIKKFVK